MNRILHFIAIACLTLLVCHAAFGATQLSSEARKHFEAGIAYVDDPNGSNWEDALKEFRTAYELSHAWQILNNIGLCALNLERDGEAIAAYKEYLSHSKDKDFSTRQRKQIESDVAMLSASLVQVTVEVDPPDAIVTDERRNARGNLVVNQYVIKDGRAVLGVHPGVHKLTVQAQGYVDAEWSFNAEPASSHQRQFKLDASKKPEPTLATPPPVAQSAPEVVTKKPTTKQPGLPTGVYVGLAATGVLTVAATVTGIVALSKDSEFNKAATRGEGDRIKSSGETFALATDIEIGAAVLSAGITAYLYFTAPKQVENKPALVSTHTNRFRMAYGSGAPGAVVAPKTHMHLTPIVAPHAAGFGVSGRF